MKPAGSGRIKRVTLGLLALAVAGTVWLPLVHLFFTEAPGRYHAKSAGVPPKARELAARHLEIWNDASLRQIELHRMRGTNAEWDFMGRTYLVLALGNAALREPDRQGAYLEVIDRIIDDTLKVEAERGMFHFLMPYARDGPYLQQPPKSLFIDSEIALMAGARRLVREDPRWAAEQRRRVKLIVERMQASPVLCCESYPDQCWMFDNAAALAAVKLGDRLDRTDHRAFFDQWLRTARSHLVDPKTGLLVSSFTYKGQHLDGPEGSSIWMVAHCLQLIDPAFARDQYQRARREIGRQILGFGFAREWPRSWQGPADVDSGPIIPIVEASAGSSGLALLGAAAFGDADFLGGLHASLEFAAFPTRTDGRYRYAASNQVGDAVLLYSMMLGPLWDKALGDAALAEGTP